MSGEITLAQLSTYLDEAAVTVDSYVKPIIAATAEKAAETQRATVLVRSGDTRDSIKATGPAGAPLGSTLEAEIGPTGSKGFKGRWIEFGTVNQAPHSFVEGSLEPHLAEHQRLTAQAATTGAMRHLTGL